MYLQELSTSNGAHNFPMTGSLWEIHELNGAITLNFVEMLLGRGGSVDDGLAIIVVVRIGVARGDHFFTLRFGVHGVFGAAVESASSGEVIVGSEMELGG